LPIAIKNRYDGTDILIDKLLNALSALSIDGIRDIFPEGEIRAYWKALLGETRNQTALIRDYFFDTMLSLFHEPIS
tara:strand:+ start:566 stop:793 length:228 start_codon:yes stop_codon:yes gene_type:complete